MALCTETNSLHSTCTCICATLRDKFPSKTHLTSWQMEPSNHQNRPISRRHSALSSTRLNQPISSMQSLVNWLEGVLPIILFLNRKPGPIICVENHTVCGMKYTSTTVVLAMLTKLLHVATLLFWVATRLERPVSRCFSLVER